MRSRGVERLIFFALLIGLVVLGYSKFGSTGPSQKPETSINFLYVGQGDSALVSTLHGHYILIDGGPDKSVLTELGKNLPPTVHKIDAIILSHPHADHVAGLDYVLDRYAVGDIYLTGAVHTAPEYLDFLKKIKVKNIPAHKSFKGQRFELDGVSFSCLYPETDESGQSFKDQNTGSSVYDVGYEGQHILMLGDLPAKEQQTIVSDKSLALNYQIMKVAHHGSKTGTLDAMVTATKPKYSVISDGIGNSFHFPAPTTLKQLASTIILRTDQRGDIRFVIDSSGVHLQ